jgi:MYND finger
MPMPTAIGSLASSHTDSSVLVFGGSSVEGHASSALALRRVTKCSYYGCKQLHKGVNLRRCTGCLVPYYCSKECQKRDWKAGHKHDCSDHKAAGYVLASGNLAWETVDGLRLPMHLTEGSAAAIML